MARSLLTGFLLVSIVASIARADGLLYQLPDDGASVQFEMKITNEKESTRTDTVVMRSVGWAGDARWLEFRRPTNSTSSGLTTAFVPRLFRGRPVADIEQGHISSASCILANLSMQLGRSITWDPAKHQVVSDEEANRLLRRPYRKAWVHPEPGQV